MRALLGLLVFTTTVFSSLYIPVETPPTRERLQGPLLVDDKEQCQLACDCARGEFNPPVSTLGSKNRPAKPTIIVMANALFWETVSTYNSCTTPITEYVLISSNPGHSLNKADPKNPGEPQITPSTAATTTTTTEPETTTNTQTTATTTEPETTTTSQASPTTTEPETTTTTQTTTTTTEPHKATTTTTESETTTTTMASTATTEPTTATAETTTTARSVAGYFQVMGVDPSIDRTINDVNIYPCRIPAHRCRSNPFITIFVWSRCEITIVPFDGASLTFAGGDEYSKTFEYQEISGVKDAFGSCRN